MSETMCPNCKGVGAFQDGHNSSSLEYCYLCDGKGEVSADVAAKANKILAPAPNVPKPPQRDTALDVILAMAPRITEYQLHHLELARAELADLRAERDGLRKALEGAKRYVQMWDAPRLLNEIDTALGVKR